MPSITTSNVWWLRFTCLFFFAGVSCFIPLLAAHLQWLGFNLQEVGFINVITSFGSALGLAIAWCWSPRCGHRSNLAVAVLLAAFCGAGLVLIPRIHGRTNHGTHYHYSEAERPVAEILCRPEGSALFFRKCGDSCQLDAVTRTELSVSDCRFEAQSRFPGNFLDWINRFAMSNPKLLPTSGSHDDDDEASEPERGDLPQKIPPSSPPSTEFDLDFEDELPASMIPREGGDDQSRNGNAAYEYDYEANHRQEVGPTDNKALIDDVNGKKKRKKKRQIIGEGTSVIDSSTNILSHHLDEELSVNEKDELPQTTSPHICFSTHSSSTTTCHVFTGTNHLFRFNTSFYTGITNNGHCFYSLNYDDVDNHILSELRCRSNKPDHQVRCRAEGVKLRASVTRNGTGTCNNTSAAGQSRNDNFYTVFWLYLVFRTCGEAAIIGAVLLLRIVALNVERDLLNPAVRWWPWALAGLVSAAPLAGWVADQAGFGIAFLLGSAMMGLSAFAVALSPSPPPKPPLGQILAGIEEEEEEDLPAYQIVGRELLTVASCRHTSTGLLILFLMLLMGMAHSVVPTVFYWYLLELNASRWTLGATISAQLIAAPFVVIFSRWLFKRCGPRYIFIIGLLVYSLRFLGYTLLYQTHWLVVMETMEPLCGLWMLLTASIRLQQLQWISSSKKKPHWKVNTWAMIILFHYSFGRGLGGLFASMAAHYFGLIRVFVSAALISLFVAAVWFFWIHLVAESLRIQPGCCQSFSRRRRRRKNLAEEPSAVPSEPARVAPVAAVDDDGDVDVDYPTQFPKGKRPVTGENQQKLPAKHEISV